MVLAQQIKDLDVVALWRDLPEERLVAGQTGTVVLTHRQGEAFEVEFPLGGRKFHVASIHRQDLLKLHDPARSPAGV